MKNKILPLLMLLGLLCGCAKQENPTSGFAVYFLARQPQYASQEGALAIEYHPELSEASDAEKLLAILLRQPEDESLCSAFPKGATCEQIELSDHTLFLQLDPSCAELTGVRKTLAAACLTKTLCQLDGVDSICISVSGGSLSFSGERYRPSDFSFD